MSRRKSSDPLGSNTRQMLDELDVLMEKMLALPVNQLDESAESPSAPATVASPPPARQSPRTGGDNSHVEEKSISVPVAQAQLVVGQLSILHSPTTHQALPTPKLPTRDDRAAVAVLATAPECENAAIGSYGVADTASEFLPPLSSLAPAVAEARLPAAQRFALRFSFRVRPLLWVNQGFDLLTQRLGVPGSWLRHSRGRACLGALGLLLLTAALTWWLKETLGWTWLWESVE